MRHLPSAVLALLFACAPATAQVADPQVVAPIQKFIDSFNKGDAAGAAATHASTPDLFIVDEVPPFAWNGAKAFQSWAGDLESYAKANGITDQMVTIKAPTRTEVHADHAYVIVPSVYSFKQKGVAMSETAQMTFVLKKGGSGWLIHGWTWTGPRAEKAK